MIYMFRFHTQEYIPPRASALVQYVYLSELHGEIQVVFIKADSPRNAANIASQLWGPPVVNFL